ncbi:four helix bundle protein [Flaviaesturariibacter amylovorans]|uniref:Four helix bundle protein n=1 Tax=Flaviaesturariibacter amylovorans TaxID=1084520 RepID=A0ABP8G8K1_9BACT
MARRLCQEIDVIIAETGLGREFKLHDQVRAAAGSITDNIAEGFGRGGNREFIQFLEVAHGSCAGTKSQIYRIVDRQYITEECLEGLLLLNARTGKAIDALIAYLQQCEIRGIPDSDTATRGEGAQPPKPLKPPKP